MSGFPVDGLRSCPGRFLISELADHEQLIIHHTVIMNHLWFDSVYLESAALVAANGGCAGRNDRQAHDSRSQCLCPIDARTAWLSLDGGDSDPVRFLTYLIAALQTLQKDLGAEVLNLLQASQPLPIEPVLTALLNEITAFQGEFTLVLDDYHLIDAQYRLTRRVPSPFCSSTCPVRCTWSSPLVKIPSYPWPGYAPRGH
jgi:hypothetical protein